VLPHGEVGEIRVKGYVTVGYYKDADKNRAAFDENGYFITGDLGFLDAEGRLYFRGRIKEMIKTGGINVAPVEVEETLMAHPAVKLACVTGVPDAQRDEIVAALVVCRPGERVEQADHERVAGADGVHHLDRPGGHPGLAGRAERQGAPIAHGQNDERRSRRQPRAGRPLRFVVGIDPAQVLVAGLDDVAAFDKVRDAGLRAMIEGSIGKMKDFFIFRSQFVQKTGSSPSLTHNLAFAQDAIGLVVRRLPQPLPGTGAIAEYAELGNFGIRVTMSYQPNTLAQQFTVDVLYGAGVLRNSFGVQILS